MSWVVWDRAWGDATVAPAQPAQPAMAIARGCSGDPRKPRVFGLFLSYLADAKCKATGFQDFYVTIAYNCSAGMHLMGFDSNRKSDAGRPQSTKTCSKTSCQLSCHCRQMQLVPLGAEDPNHTCSAWHLKVGTVRHCETLWDRVSHKTPPQRVQVQQSDHQPFWSCQGYLSHLQAQAPVGSASLKQSRKHAYPGGLMPFVSFRTKQSFDRRTSGGRLCRKDRSKEHCSRSELSELLFAKS